MVHSFWDFGQQSKPPGYEMVEFEQRQWPLHPAAAKAGVQSHGVGDQFTEHQKNAGGQLVCSENARLSWANSSFFVDQLKPLKKFNIAQQCSFELGNRQCGDATIYAPCGWN